MLELKTKLPGKALGEAAQRAAKQIQAAIDNKFPIGVLTRTKHRVPTHDARMQDIRAMVTGDPNMATFLHGTMSLVSFVKDYVFEECLENSLR